MAVASTAHTAIFRISLTTRENGESHDLSQDNRPFVHQAGGRLCVVRRDDDRWRLGADVPQALDARPGALRAEPDAVDGSGGQRALAVDGVAGDQDTRSLGGR